MNISIKTPVQVEFGGDSLDKGCQLFRELQRSHSKEVMDALFAVLSFRAIEDAQPGTLENLTAGMKPEIAGETVSSDQPA